MARDVYKFQDGRIWEWLALSLIVLAVVYDLFFLTGNLNLNCESAYAFNKNRDIILSKTEKYTNSACYC